MSGRDTVLTRLNAQIAELTELLALETGEHRRGQREHSSTLEASLAAAETERDRLQGLLDSQSDAAQLRPGDRVAQLTAELEAEKQVSQRALSQVELLNQQIAALRRQIAALEDGARRLRGPRPGKPDQDRRSRPAAECRAGPARPGARPATAPTSSDACARSSATGPTSASSATASSSSPRCSSRPARTRSARAGLERTRQARRGGRRADPGDPRRHPLGAPRRRPHRQAADHRPAAASAPTGSFPPARAISVVRYLIEQGHPGRTAWWRRASASSSRSRTATPKRPTAKNRRIELKLTER